MKKVFWQLLFLVFLVVISSSLVFAVPEDITITVDVDKIVAVIPIPEERDPKTMSNETFPLYDTNREWVEVIITDYLIAQERRFRSTKKAEIARDAEAIDATVAVIKK